MVEFDLGKQTRLGEEVWDLPGGSLGWGCTAPSPPLFQLHILTILFHSFPQNTLSAHIMSVFCASTWFPSCLASLRDSAPTSIFISPHLIPSRMPSSEYNSSLPLGPATLPIDPTIYLSFCPPFIYPSIHPSNQPASQLFIHSATSQLASYPTIHPSI